MCLQAAEPRSYIVGRAAGLAFGLGGWLLVGLVVAPADLTIAADPRTVLARDRRAFLTVGLMVGFMVVLGLGFAFGLGYGLYEAAWGWFGVARCWLALRRRLPWRLMTFLADAHQRGVLRQAGAVYQFRHIELQRRLATRCAPGEDVEHLS